jgi:hypothetical protein
MNKQFTTFNTFFNQRPTYPILTIMGFKFPINAYRELTTIMPSMGPLLYTWQLLDNSIWCAFCNMVFFHWSKGGGGYKIYLNVFFSFSFYKLITFNNNFKNSNVTVCICSYYHAFIIYTIIYLSMFSLVIKYH